jgi:hypothetical protein
MDCLRRDESVHVVEELQLLRRKVLAKLDLIEGF